MSRLDHQGSSSTAAIGGHPIHPMLVAFPIAFLVGTLATDLAFWRAPYGIVLSAIVVAFLLVTGWLGGELVFRHGIGIIDSKNESG